MSDDEKIKESLQKLLAEESKNSKFKDAKEEEWKILLAKELKYHQFWRKFDFYYSIIVFPIFAIVAIIVCCTSI